MITRVANKGTVLDGEGKTQLSWVCKVGGSLSGDNFGGTRYFRPNVIIYRAKSKNISPNVKIGKNV